MQKYQQYYAEMVSQNLSLFHKFKKIHADYALDQNKFQKEFNEVGSEVLELIRIWEGKLCGKSEGGGYGKFSANLADKFWEEVRRNFQYIDMVGVS